MFFFESHVAENDDDLKKDKTPAYIPTKDKNLFDPHL